MKERPLGNQHEYYACECKDWHDKIANKIIRLMRQVLEQKYKKNISENALLLYYTIIKMENLDQRFSINEAVELAGKEADIFQECLTQNLPDKINLQKAGLKGMNLPRMVFIHADLNDADLGNALLTGTKCQILTIFTSMLQV